MSGHEAASSAAANANRPHAPYVEARCKQITVVPAAGRRPAPTLTHSFWATADLFSRDSAYNTGHRFVTIWPSLLLSTAYSRDTKVLDGHQQHVGLRMVAALAGLAARDLKQPSGQERRGTLECKLQRLSRRNVIASKRHQMAGIEASARCIPASLTPRCLDKSKRIAIYTFLACAFAATQDGVGTCTSILRGSTAARRSMRDRARQALDTARASTHSSSRLPLRGAHNHPRGSTPVAAVSSTWLEHGRVRLDCSGLKIEAVVSRVRTLTVELTPQFADRHPRASPTHRPKLSPPPRLDHGGSVRGCHE